jgi:hypothetical protein
MESSTSGCVHVRRGHTLAPSSKEVVTMIRRFINRMKERRAARKARKLETAHRRAAEGYDPPPMGFDA